MSKKQMNFTNSIGALKMVQYSNTTKFAKNRVPDAYSDWRADKQLYKNDPVVKQVFSTDKQSMTLTLQATDRPIIRNTKASTVGNYPFSQSMLKRSESIQRRTQTVQIQKRSDDMIKYRNKAELMNTMYQVPCVTHSKNAVIPLQVAMRGKQPKMPDENKKYFSCSTMFENYIGYK